MEVLMMYETTSINKRPLGFLSSPVVLIRLSSILFVGLMIGHMSTYPWASNHALQETQLVDLMKSVDFVFMGERSTYWNLYFVFAALIAVLLLSFYIIPSLFSHLPLLAPPLLVV